MDIKDSTNTPVPADAVMSDQVRAQEVKTQSNLTAENFHVEPANHIWRNGEKLKVNAIV